MLDYHTFAVAHEHLRSDRVVAYSAVRNDRKVHGLTMKYLYAQTWVLGSRTHSLIQLPVHCLASSLTPHVSLAPLLTYLLTDVLAHTLGILTGANTMAFKK